MNERFLAFLIWGIGTVVIYTVLLWQQRVRYVAHRDARSRREMVSAVALWLTALGSALGIAFVLFGEAGNSARSFAVAISLGAFTGAGLLMVDGNLRKYRG